MYPENHDRNNLHNRANFSNKTLDRGVKEMSRDNMIKIIGDTMMKISTPIVILCWLLENMSIRFTALRLAFTPFVFLGFILDIAGYRIEKMENEHEWYKRF